MRKLSKIAATILATLACSTSVFASNVQIGAVEAGSDIQTITISGFTDPVIIAGVPSRDDTDKGVVSISNVTATSFDIKFNEWTYLDGVHDLERIPYMVVERGRHTMADGSVWEAGTVSQNKGSDEVLFSQSFAGTPILLQSPQSQVESHAYGLRAFSVGQHAFGSKLFEQELNNNHGTETTGYVAIYNPDGLGKTDTGHYYNMHSTVTAIEGTPTNFGIISVEEEQSLDYEMNHSTEVLNIFEIGGHTFANDISIFGADSTSLRYTAIFNPMPTNKTNTKGNIALMGTNGLDVSNYSASSVFGSGTSYTAASAFDGHIYGKTKINEDAGAYYKSAAWLTYQTFPQWLGVDFGKLARITGFSTRLFATNVARSVKDVVIQTSDDGVNYNDHESFVLTPIDADINLQTPVVTQYIRLKILSAHTANAYMEIDEVEFYGSFVEYSDDYAPAPPVVDGETCKTILDGNPSATSGIYTIEPDASDNVPPFKAYCDMVTQGGGWTLVAIRDKSSYPAPELTIVTDPTINEGVLISERWMPLKAVSTQMYASGSNDVWALYDVSTLNSANCTPLSDSLSSLTIAHAEGDCNAVGSDYSVIGSGNPTLTSYSTSLYDYSTTPLILQRGGTGWGIYTNGKPYTNPEILHLYVR